jgi:protein-S-isoprenylcysteine O-methyltransferase Ste14
MENGSALSCITPQILELYCLQTWRFFKHRIAVEEVHLQRQFGEEYSEYARGVPTYIPFIP